MIRRPRHGLSGIIVSPGFSGVSWLVAQANQRRSHCSKWNGMPKWNGFTRVVSRIAKPGECDAEANALSSPSLQLHRPPSSPLPAK